MMRRLLFVVTALSLFVFPACMVSQSDYDKLADELASTRNQLAAVQDQLESEQSQLAAIKAKYPLRDFASVDEATAWATQHQRPALNPNVADQGYAICMEIQKEAELDGYRVWINWDENAERTGGILVLWTHIDSKLYFWGYDKPKLYEVSTIVPQEPSSN